MLGEENKSYDGVWICLKSLMPGEALKNVSDEKGGPVLFCSDGRLGSVWLAWFCTANVLERLKVLRAPFRGS